MCKQHYGEQCMMIFGIQPILVLFVSNWDSQDMVWNSIQMVNSKYYSWTCNFHNARLNFIFMAKLINPYYVSATDLNSIQ